MSLLQETLLRVSDRAIFRPPVIICNEKHRFITAEHVLQAGITDAVIMLEETRRNTAPAITLAALYAQENYDSDTMLVLPSDHKITNTGLFIESVLEGGKLAHENIVTFGIKPSCPSSAYGYIKQGVGCSIEAFIEKPDSHKAEQFIQEGGYFWNSGMFIFSPQIFLRELEKFEPEILRCCLRAYKSVGKDTDFLRIKVEYMTECPDKSIDYAVMEKTSKAKLIKLKSDWSDIGSWNSLYDYCSKDTGNNVTKGNVITADSSDNYIDAGEKTAVIAGIDNAIIVNTKDALLVINKTETEKLKNLIDGINLDNHKEYRPWGFYETIDDQEGYRVKRIIVKPGGKLSLQRHEHRSEHWVVIKGSAKVQSGDKYFTLNKGESTYIPEKSIHRLENSGSTDLEIIEIQTGRYISEDDIERFEDLYKRA